MMLASPREVKISQVGVITCIAPTNTFNGAADLALTTPSNINPFRNRTAPTYNRPTLAMTNNLPRVGNSRTRQPRQPRIGRRHRRPTPRPTGRDRGHHRRALTRGRRVIDPPPQVTQPQPQPRRAKTQPPHPGTPPQRPPRRAEPPPPHTPTHRTPHRRRRRPHRHRHLEQPISATTVFIRRHVTLPGSGARTGRRSRAPAGCCEAGALVVLAVPGGGSRASPVRVRRPRTHVHAAP